MCGPEASKGNSCEFPSSAYFVVREGPMPFPPVIPMNAFARQWEDTRTEVVSAVEKVGRSGWYILGREVADFESGLAEFCGTKYAVGCASGLDAIEMSLRALDLAPGQKVLTSPLSAFATTLAILRAGGTPVFCDTDASGLLDLDKAEDLLERDQRVRFLVPVHLYGHAMHMERLSALRNRFGLKIVEDCAQAIGARHVGAPVGSVGDLAALSFYPTKNLGALGDGGAVLAATEELAAKCRCLRDYGQSAKYVHDLPGLNSRLDELHAAILNRVYLPRLAEWTMKRREIAAGYLAGIDNPAVVPLPVPAGSESVWHLFPVLVEADSRAAFRAYLTEQGVESGLHYPFLITEQKALGLAAGRMGGNQFESAGRLSREEVSLPLGPYLADDEVERVIQAVNSWEGR